MSTWWCNLFFLVILTIFVTGNEENQKIETVLYAKWSPTSPLSEAAEYIADVNPNLFWEFLENVFKQSSSFPIPANSDEAEPLETDLASVASFNLISPAKLRMMEWAITSKAYSPRVLMLSQMAPASDCESFVHFSDDRVSCDLDEVKKILEGGSYPSNKDKIFITEFEHKYPSFVWNSPSPPLAVLYGHPLSSGTKDLHQYLKSKADKIGYIYRPYRPASASKGRLVLSGYGIELQFKSTEYLAQDDSDKAKDEKVKEIGGFLFDKLHDLYPNEGESLEKFQNHLASKKGRKAEFEALKAWQIQELGLQASHFATLQPNFLEALMDITGNFPSKAASLSSIRVPIDFKKSVTFNQQILGSHFNIDEGEGALFLQGNYMDPDALDLFTFMESLKSEIEFMEILKSVNHDRSLTRSQIDKVLSLGSKSTAEPELALDLRDSSVYWMNDLEKDEEYEDWPDDLSQLFFRMGGVMLRPVKRNVFNLVLTLDPEDITGSGGLLKIVHSFMEHKAPVRIGLVFCDSRKEMLNSIEEPTSAIIRKVLNYAQSQEMMRKAFSSIVDAYTTEDFSKILKDFMYPDEEFTYGNDASCEFVKRSGRPLPGAFLNGIPLKWDSIDDFEETVLNQLLKEAQAIQIESYNGRIRDDTDIFEHLMNKPSVLARLNDKILDTSKSKFFSFGTEIWELGKVNKNEMASFAGSLKYLEPSSRRKEDHVTVTHWILADIGTPKGQRFLSNAVEFLVNSAKHSRIAFIPTGLGSSAFKRSVHQAIEDGDLKKLSQILKDTSDEGNDDGPLDQSYEKVQSFLKFIGFPHGAQGLIVNGRLIGPLGEEEDFELGDWSLVEKVSYDSCAKHFDEEWTPDSVMRICSFLDSPSIKTRNAKRFSLPEFDQPQLIGGGGGEDLFFVDLTAVIDPASRLGNKMASILNAVQDTVGQWMRIRVIFNPPSKHSELPLKSYFRYVAGEKLAERIVFENMPKEPLFTQHFMSPDNWMVEVVKGENDLDNIRLRDLSTSVSSEYELEYLLVEGHCLELKTGSPPRGVQFNFEPSQKGGKIMDTIVMANLGYFQLKAAPGIWKLSLRDGPSNDIYALEAANTKPTLVHNFQSIVLKIKLKRNPGKDMASVLDSEDDSAGWFGFGKKDEKEEDEAINVFSLASGHLYERLARIMMLSVLKNTKSKVKFWFLKNYISPTFKNILPEMAKEYNFEYELVQYHWPRWLNAQREKQRIIWGYKILFLDVLFPLSLKKFVFVDADQIVRADLKELFELDLEGNPYAYTPFCDSRTEMEGFRFWKQGYWKSHLGRRKYHISALYVVDLVRFRKVAAGDRLRGQYQALSQDPNSLSNLDQDLPNNMIHQVGIKSLPQEWLWCETWCDDASKKYAKTIDLCNNPQTKEPKLDAAQRIVPEWISYDQEIREFVKRLQSKGIQVEDDKAATADEHDEL